MPDAAELRQHIAEALEKSSPVFGTVYGTMALAAHHMNLHTLEIKDID